MMKGSEQLRKKNKQDGPLSEWTVNNGCSINQSNIIKFKQLEFSSYLLEPDSKHGFAQSLR